MGDPRTNINRKKDFLLEVARGNIEGHSFIHKFGEGTDIDSGDGFVDIWDGAGNANADKVYTFSSTADIDTISSSSGSDTVDIEIQGLDTNFALVTQTITLTGQTKATLTTPLIRVFRMKNVGATNLVGQVYCYVDGAITAGVPDTSADIRAIIDDGKNQTLMSIYTIPAGKTGYLLKEFASMSKAVASAVADIHLAMREFGGVFQLKETLSINTAGNPSFQYEYPIPLVIPEKFDILLIDS